MITLAAPRRKAIDFESHRDQAMVEDHGFLRARGLRDRDIAPRLGFRTRDGFEKWMQRKKMEVRW